MATDRLSGTPDSVAVKLPCRVAATSNITLSGLQTVDSVVLAAGDRVLVAGQTTQTENGVWIADTSDWNRAADSDGNREFVRGTFVNVYAGTAASGWYEVTASDPVLIGSSNITFQRWILTPG